MVHLHTAHIHPRHIHAVMDRGRCHGLFSRPALTPVLLNGGGMGQVSHGLEALTPDRCPRQAGEQQEQGKAGDPNSRHGMEIAPKQLLAHREARPDHPRQALGLPRPPQIEPADDHDDGPGRGQLDKVRAPIPHQKLAVNGLDHLDRAILIIDLMKDREGLGVDIDEHCLALGADLDTGGIVRIVPHLVGFQAPARHRCEGGCNLLIGAGGGSGKGQMVIGPVQPSLNLRLEQIERAAERQDDDEGHTEQPRIEMPAPEGAIEVEGRF